MANTSAQTFTSTGGGTLSVVSGTFDSTGQSPAFQIGRGMFNVSLWGTFSGSVKLERSFDGSTWLPITAAGVQLYAWSAPASEVAEEPGRGVQYRLNCTAISSGTINYRMDQTQ